MHDPNRRGRRASRPADAGSATRSRLLWAVAGVLVFVAAKYAFGF